MKPISRREALRMVSMGAAAVAAFPMNALAQTAFPKAAGANDEILGRITVDNPRQFLAFVPKRARKRGT